jgi:diguanylate cyclase (GGDEF)-like protein/PAS domain S-box-containing protein
VNDETTLSDALDTVLPRVLRAIVDSAPVGVIVLDSGGHIVLVNAEIEALLGYTRCELLGTPVARLVPSAVRADHARWQQQFMQHPDTRSMGRGRDVAAQRKDGTEVTVEIGLRVLDENGIGVLIVAILVDVSERRRLHELARRASERLEERVRERTAELEAALRLNQSLLRDLQVQRAALEQLSREDPLTGLCNRREFERRLSEEIQRSERLGAPLAVAMLDIDHFKTVNDRFGHGVGDVVLQQIAALIRTRIRAVDILARYGGEEFALIMPGTSGVGAVELCERIRKAFHDFSWSMIHGALVMPVTISIGVATWGHGLDARRLLDEADRNLYVAKHAGRDRVVFPCQQPVAELRPEGE